MQLYNKLSAQERAVLLEEAGTERSPFHSISTRTLGTRNFFAIIFSAWNKLEVLGRI